MSSSATHGTYNLLDEPWIPMLYRDGKAVRVGILEALREARKIRQIGASNPMDHVALLRFLIAVLLWCKPDVKSALAALPETSPGIPDDWLAKLQKDRDMFNLLGDGKRFYQDSRLKHTPRRPVADLLVEFPGADSVNHMRHVVYEEFPGFCPACCAMGIIRLSVWAPTNGHYPASVNPPSAAYAFAEGISLFETLHLNFPDTHASCDDPPWGVTECPEHPDVVFYLAWRPRKLWLFEDQAGRCGHCGQEGVLIKEIAIKRGWNKPLKYWSQDPHLLLKVKEKKPLSLPGLDQDVAQHASHFWRTAFNISRQRDRKVTQWQRKITAVGPVVKQHFVFHDATSVSIPEGVSEELIQHSESMLKGKVKGKGSKKGKVKGKDCKDKYLYKIVTDITPNPDRSHLEICAAIVLETPDTERTVQERSKSDCEIPLHQLYEPIIERIIQSYIKASPLRQQEAMRRAKHMLQNKIHKLAERKMKKEETK